jgi:hypothetical protein
VLLELVWQANLAGLENFVETDYAKKISATTTREENE